VWCWGSNEEGQLGGNCTMTDAIPSKTLLTTADAMLEIQRAEDDGVDFDRGYPAVNLRRLQIQHAIPDACAQPWQRIG